MHLEDLIMPDLVDDSEAIITGFRRGNIFPSSSTYLPSDGIMHNYGSINNGEVKNEGEKDVHIRSRTCWDTDFSLYALDVYNDNVKKTVKSVMKYDEVQYDDVPSLFNRFIYDINKMKRLKSFDEIHEWLTSTTYFQECQKLKNFSSFLMNDSMSSEMIKPTKKAIVLLYNMIQAMEILIESEKFATTLLKINQLSENEHTTLHEMAKYILNFNDTFQKILVPMTTHRFEMEKINCSHEKDKLFVLLKDFHFKYELAITDEVEILKNELEEKEKLLKELKGKSKSTNSHSSKSDGSAQVSMTTQTKINYRNEMLGIGEVRSDILQVIEHSLDSLSKDILSLRQDNRDHHDKIYYLTNKLEEIEAKSARHLNHFPQKDKESLFEVQMACESLNKDIEEEPELIKTVEDRLQRAGKNRSRINKS
ncbi:hypothetical protein SNEBB_002743 [Seison nebaliae]|nr:hypothetical protein SNEBB_002743 [Seison nebaliae]